MRNRDPQHELLVEARDTLHRLETKREEIRRAHGSGQFSPASPMLRMNRLVSAAITRVERRREACVCDRCREATAEDRAEYAADQAYDRMVDDELTDGVRGR